MPPTVAMLIGLGIGLFVVIVVILATVLYVRLRPTQTYHPHHPTPDSPYAHGFYGQAYGSEQCPPNCPR